MSVINDPRVTPTSVEQFGASYRIEGGPTGYSVVHVSDGWSDTGEPAGWVVFNGYMVWIGHTSDPLVSPDEVEARGVYPTDIAAVGAVLAALDAAQ